MSAPSAFAPTLSSAPSPQPARSTAVSTPRPDLYRADTDWFAILFFFLGMPHVYGFLRGRKRSTFAQSGS
ncbi:MAG: hypothetical protein VKK80_13010 [Prochlorothrix sp.]|nr:hypothetical protein [Prochlorothrix sp.]